MRLYFFAKFTIYNVIFTVLKLCVEFSDIIILSQMKGSVNMKQKIKKFCMKFGGTFAALAVVVATMTANSTCVWCTHQPELSEDVKKLRKF